VHASKGECCGNSSPFLVCLAGIGRTIEMDHKLIPQKSLTVYGATQYDGLVSSNFLNWIRPAPGAGFFLSFCLLSKMHLHRDISALKFMVLITCIQYGNWIYILRCTILLLTKRFIEKENIMSTVNATLPRAGGNGAALVVVVADLFMGLFASAKAPANVKVDAISAAPVAAKRTKKVDIWQLYRMSVSSDSISPDVMAALED
jgi:hypothetical protein